MSQEKKYHRTTPHHTAPHNFQMRKPHLRFCGVKNQGVYVSRLVSVFPNAGQGCRRFRDMFSCDLRCLHGGQQRRFLVAPDPALPLVFLFPKSLPCCGIRRHFLGRHCFKVLGESAGTAAIVPTSLRNSSWSFAQVVFFIVPPFPFPPSPPLRDAWSMVKRITASNK